MTSRPRQWFDYCLLCSLLRLARPMPRTLLLALGRGLGSSTWRVFRFRRQVVRENLGHAFADLDARQRDALALAFYRSLGMTLMEFLVFPRLRRRDFLDLVEMEGIRHLHAAAALGKGALIVTGHMGNWEMLGARAAASGYQVTAAAKTQSNARVDRMQNGIRRRAGVDILKTDSGVKAMLKALRQGRMVALVADQDAGSEGYFTPFLGRPASFFKGPALFAYRTGVPMLTVFIHRLDDRRHRVVIEPAVQVDPTWDEDQAVAALTTHFAARLEAAVRRNPEQYFWVHRRWKTQPPDEAPGSPD
ncbi:lysophospholipid acyltransferase family protein [bacterium]|nr:lysophospholipid acyltransferase family protein [bacterium]PJA75622.1 MAG: hypothetical protein CO151_05385 [bacterium CG_4_9_14_3_um_filter_65_15]